MGFPAAYLVTLIVEVPAVAAVGTWLRLATLQRLATSAAVANLVTVPLLWFVVMAVLQPRLGWLAAVLWGEALVVVIEAAVYAAWLRCGVFMAAALSLGANSLSVLAGLLLDVRT